MTETYYHAEQISPNRVGFQALRFFEKAKTIGGRSVVRTYIRIETPGEMGTQELVLDDELKRRYAKEYEQWLEKKDNSLIGTPLSEAGIFDSETCRLLGEDRIYTLEQMASAPDSFCRNAKLKEYRKRAQVLMDTKKSSQYINNLELEIGVLKEEIKELRNNYRILMTEKGASEEAKDSEIKGKRKAVAKKNKISQDD